MSDDRYEDDREGGSMDALEMASAALASFAEEAHSALIVRESGDADDID